MPVQRNPQSPYSDDTLRRFRQQIGELAPQEEKSRNGRDELFGRLLQMGDHFYNFTILAIKTAFGMYRSEQSRFDAKVAEEESQKKDVYFKNIERIYRIIEELNTSPLIKDFYPEIHLYDPNEIECSHNKARRFCYECADKPQLGQLVFSITGHDSYIDFPEDDIFLKHTRKKVKKFRYDIPEYLLQTLIPRYQKAGLSIHNACNYVQDILKYCFGLKYNPNTLETEYHRYRKNLADREEDLSLKKPEQK